MLTLSNRDARRFLLAHQLLWPPRSLKGKKGVEAVFARLGSVQYDTINVVGRNADLVMQARIRGYTADVLDEMLYSDRTLVDGWDKMASIHPMDEFPYFQRRRKSTYKAAASRSAEAVSYESQIIDAIREQGPLSSLAFNDNHEAGGQTVDWWWAPTKLARATMEALFWKDALGIHHKVNTRRVFDLAENLYPDHVLNAPDPHPDDEDYKDWHTLRRLGSLGLTDLRRAEYWYGIPFIDETAERRRVIARLVERGDALDVAVEGVKEVLYMRAQDLSTLEAVQTDRTPRPKAAFIAPLDNLMWNRAMIGQLFGFEYIWEVYKPAKDRQYGYYTLPVLYGDRFVARFDGKLDRKTMVLNVNGWWWEPDARPSATMVKAIQSCLTEFGRYLEVDGIQAGETLDKEGRKTLGL